LCTVSGVQAFDGDHDADDGIFTAQAGLDHSVHFAATGSNDVFDDDHLSLGNVIDVEGLSTAAHKLVTIGLRLGHHGDDDGDNDADDQGGNGHGKVGEHGHAGAPPVAHGPKVSQPGGGGGASTSATPEPASMLLLATGLAGVILYRRQLFA